MLHTLTDVHMEALLTGGIWLYKGAGQFRPILTSFTLCVTQRDFQSQKLSESCWHPCSCRYLLPPIIFYAGLSVKKKQFFRNFATIASFGILGTYAAFALIALVLYGLAQLPNVLNLSVGPSGSCMATDHSRAEPGILRSPHSLWRVS